MTGRASVGVPTREVTVAWRGEGLRFDSRAGDRPAVLVDGNTEVAVSPVELLLVAAATCAGSDVVLILQKQRVELRRLDIHALGTRRPTEPRRYTAMHFRFTVAGDGADEARVRRAVSLSLEKYCSVVATLAPDTAITYDIVIS